MDYSSVLEHLFRMERFGIKLGLSNIVDFLTHLGNPHLFYPTVHVAGTNGKGSVVAMLGAVLSAAGYKTGIYTSPHLIDFRERIRIGENLIEKDYIVDFFGDNIEKINALPLTYFEAVTALAFSYFKDQKVDIALIETGMGGRFDATNVICPLISVITNISLEHTEWLGKSEEKIAFEKGGIIKKGVPVITAVNQNGAKDVIKKISQNNNCRFLSIFDEVFWEVRKISREKIMLNISTPQRFHQNLSLELAGRHQIENALCAVCAVDLLNESTSFKISPKAVANGLKEVKWAGRMQRIDQFPETILDVAHNPTALSFVVEYFKEFYSQDKVVVVFGILKDKDHEAMIRCLKNFAHIVVFAKPNTERAKDPALLISELSKVDLDFKIIPDVCEAYRFARELAGSNGVVLVTGSHYTVGEVISQFSPTPLLN